MTVSNFSEMRPSRSLHRHTLYNVLPDEEFGLFSPPSSPEAPASEERKSEKVLPKVESSLSSSGESSTAKTSGSPSKSVKGGDNWECEIDDLLGDDSDDEVCGLDIKLFSSPFTPTNLFQ